MISASDVPSENPGEEGDGDSSLVFAYRVVSLDISTLPLSA